MALHKVFARLGQNFYRVNCPPRPLQSRYAVIFDASVLQNSQGCCEKRKKQLILEIDIIISSHKGADSYRIALYSKSPYCCCLQTYRACFVLIDPYLKSGGQKPEVGGLKRWCCLGGMGVNQETLCKIPCWCLDMS
jgi:hypothetical protein